MIPCINQQTTLPLPFETACRAYSEAGFRHIELWLDRLREEGLSSSSAAATLRRYDLNAVCACSSNLHLTAAEEEFRQGLASMRPSLEYCRAVGANSYVVFSPAVQQPAPADYDGIPARLALAADLAATYGVRLAVEFFARSNLLGCLPTALSMLRAAGNSNLGICLDAFHLFAGPSKTEDLADLRQGDIAHVHFHDAPAAIPRERLKDADRLPPGEGGFPLERLTTALQRIGYQGPLSVELFGAEFHNGDPLGVAQRCFRAVSRYTAG